MQFIGSWQLFLDTHTFLRDAQNNWGAGMEELYVQRTREIGIRKVLGATVLQLWRLLSKEFLWLVGLSFLIGMPLAFYGLQHWLQQYPCHAGIRWWIFAGTAAGMLIIILLTISFHTIKTALANPVKSLRAE